MNNKILVFLIDDDREDQMFFELAVSKMDIPVECRFADDCNTALCMLKNAQFNPDFIFVDINMPKMNGMEILSKIREIDRLEHLPVYIYSTSADKYIIANCFKLGAAGIIKKQTSIYSICEKLLGVFERYLATHS